jgi:hypothetical protein
MASHLNGMHKARRWALLAAALAIAALAALYFGIHLIQSHGSASCGGSVMHEGDRCITYHNGVPEGGASPSSQRGHNAAVSHSFGWILVVVAAVLCLQSINAFVEARKAKGSTG